MFGAATTTETTTLRARRQKRDIEVRVRRIAEEEALILTRRQRMSPDDIIHYYTGEKCRGTTLDQAIATIVRFNMDIIESRGFAAI